MIYLRALMVGAGFLRSCSGLKACHNDVWSSMHLGALSSPSLSYYPHCIWAQIKVLVVLLTVRYFFVVVCVLVAAFHTPLYSNRHAA